MVRLIVMVGGILVDLGGLKYKYKYKISYKYKHKCLWSVRLIVTVRGIAVPALDASLGSLLSARFHSTSQFKIQIQIHVKYEKQYKYKYTEPELPLQKSKLWHVENALLPFRSLWKLDAVSAIFFFPMQNMS